MESERFQLILGDCLDRLKDLPADSVSAIVTDPPYDLEFMGIEKERPYFEIARRRIETEYALAV